MGSIKLDQGTIHQQQQHKDKVTKSGEREGTGVLREMKYLLSKEERVSVCVCVLMWEVLLHVLLLLANE